MPIGKYYGTRESSLTGKKASAISLLLLLPLLWFGAKLRSTVYAAPTQEMLRVPLKAVEYLKENHLAGNTFTNPNIWGGYLIWALPENPVYIDGRGVFPEEFVREYVELIQGIRDWHGPFDRYDVRIIVIKPDSLLAQQLAESDGWTQVYQDELSVAFVRR